MIMSDKNIILASKSPRRKELLENAGFNAIILPSDADENISEDNPVELVKKLSFLKAESVYNKVKEKDELSYLPMEKSLESQREKRKRGR